MNKAVQIADSIKILMQDQDVYAYNFSGICYGAENKSDYVLAVIKFALKDVEIKRKILDCVGVHLWGKA